jgi:hypothetical protein
MADYTGRGCFRRGRSGNPGGRPKLPAEMREMFQAKGGAPGPAIERIELLEARQSRQERRRLFAFYPEAGPLRRPLYAKHIAFFAAGAKYRERCMMAVTVHLTGLYPDWWEGKRFAQPVRALVAGDTGTTVRDIVQKKLCGPVEAPGTGRQAAGRRETSRLRAAVLPPPTGCRAAFPRIPMEILFSAQFIFDQLLFRVPSFPTHRPSRKGACRTLAIARLRASTFATCTASRPLPSLIWWRQEVPSATTMASPALRTAGSRESSAMAKDTSTVSAP